ncbi:MAG TPA: hypothetical protein VIY73_11795 [Polyangiaceae bacterium]
MVEEGSTPLGAGAAEGAPTAPHATPRTGGGKRTGPERFWLRWPMRLVLVACLVASGVAHCAVVPLEVPHGFEIEDVDGEATIPIDILTAADEPPAQATAEPKGPGDQGPNPAALPPRMRDAGVASDAGAHDAGPDARADAGLDGSTDGSSEGGFSDGAVPLAEAGPIASDPKDPQSIVGVAGAVQAGDVLVLVVVNAEVIRKNPVGAKMGFLLRGIKQWDDFMKGTDIDPVKDTDWLMISGPSLVNSTRDVILIHYSTADARVEKAMAVVSAGYASGGPFDAGVPGVKAMTTHADGAERVMLRPQPHVLAVVPTNVAQKMARVLSGARVQPHIRPGEAAYIRVVNPHHPMPEIPETITAMSLRVVPRADEGADVFIDGDTKDAAAAVDAAAELRNVVKRHDDFVTASLTHGLLDHVDVTAEGSEVKLHLTASRDQIEAVVSLVAAFLDVKPGGPTVPPASSHP